MGQSRTINVVLSQLDSQCPTLCIRTLLTLHSQKVTLSKAFSAKRNIQATHSQENRAHLKVNQQTQCEQNIQHHKINDRVKQPTDVKRYQISVIKYRSRNLFITIYS